MIDRRISRLFNLPSVFQPGKRVVLPGLVDCVGGCLAIGKTDRFLEGGKLMTKGRVNEGRRGGSVTYHPDFRAVKGGKDSRVFEWPLHVHCMQIVFRRI